MRNTDGGVGISSTDGGFQEVLVITRCFHVVLLVLVLYLPTQVKYYQ